jgi:hypothetical protein
MLEGKERFRGREFSVFVEGSEVGGVISAFSPCEEFLVPAVSSIGRVSVERFFCLKLSDMVAAACGAIKTAVLTTGESNLSNWTR